MEYLLGAVIGISSVFLIAKYFSKIWQQPVSKVRYSQSHVFTIVGAISSQLGIREELSTQSTKFFDSKHQRILFFKGRAYWIRDNSVYSANLVNGIVDENSTKVLDIMAMDKVELTDMMFIIDKLNEGRSTDDTGSTR